ncbi:MAG: hypothetical protein V3W51_04570 [Candidatus Brocadiales bacterium]
MEFEHYLTLLEETPTQIVVRLALRSGDGKYSYPRPEDMEDITLSKPFTFAQLRLAVLAARRTIVEDVKSTEVMLKTLQARLNRGE